MSWFETGVLIGLALIWFAIVEGIRRIENSLSAISNQLSTIDELVGRIPGVEDYSSPEGAEWFVQTKKNPNANAHNRRNWTR
jgi:hypothetical protein